MEVLAEFCPRLQAREAGRLLGALRNANKMTEPTFKDDEGTPVATTEQLRLFE